LSCGQYKVTIGQSAFVPVGKHLCSLHALAQNKLPVSMRQVVIFFIVRLIAKAMGVNVEEELPKFREAREDSRAEEPIAVEEAKEEAKAEEKLIVKKYKGEIIEKAKAEEKPIVVEEAKAEEKPIIKKYKGEIPTIVIEKAKAEEKPIVVEEAKEETKAEEKPIAKKYKGEIIKKAKEEVKVEKPVIIKETKEEPKKEQADKIKAPHVVQRNQHHMRILREGKEYIPGKGKLSVSMLPGKHRHRCIHLSFHNVHCDKDAAEGIKYFKEHIESQCKAINPPSGKQCKNKCSGRKFLHTAQEGTRRIQGGNKKGEGEGEGG